MKEVLLSIRPKWCEKIGSGEKKIEVRKTRPKEVPFKCYIYATRPKRWFRFGSCGYASDESLWLSNGEVKMCDGFEFWADGIKYEPLNGKVIGEFICDYIDEIIPDFQFGYLNYLDLESTCLTIEEINKYGNGNPLYGWHISNLVIYDKPKELSDLGLTRPPQSWQYVLNK